MIRKFLTIISVMALMSGPASSRHALHVVKQDDGGVLAKYIGKYARWAEEKDNVRIEGDCLSACTLMLGYLDRKHICATRDARFGFHSASNTGKYSEEGTVLMWFFYSPRVRSILADNGWATPSPHPDFIMINAQEIVKACE